MGNPATLKTNVFTSENQPSGAKKSRKGIPNRATVYKTILNSKTKETLLNGTQKTMTVYEAAALGQIKAAIDGNTSAWVEIQNSLHGKQTDKIEHSGEQNDRSGIH